jgi:hypothetical protein
MLLRAATVAAGVAAASAFVPAGHLPGPLHRVGRPVISMQAKYDEVSSEDSRVPSRRLGSMGNGPKSMAPSRINMVEQKERDVAKKSKYGVLLTPEVFMELDADGSGAIDLEELKALFGPSSREEDVEMLMLRADLDGNGEIDYAEFERLMKMQKNGDDNGGNLWVRNAIKAGFLRGNSILADGAASLVPGNKGFDPLGFATGEDAADSLFRLKNYREAELKHGRLAMLATVGWPMAELFHPGLAELKNAENLLAYGGQDAPAFAPSVLNGGLEQFQPLLMAILVFSATIETKYVMGDGRKAFLAKDWVAGNLGFDPLGFYNSKDVSARQKRELELKEINNGRLAMLAISSFAALEFISKTPVVDLTPALFGRFVELY